MRASHRRLDRLEAKRPRCDGRIQRIIGPDEPWGDPCPGCGRHHVLVIEEQIIESGAVRDNGAVRCA
jgi:hypothetical protein